ncbi:MAG: hypothetical protein LIO90_11775 [Bacteroidales bacterium]|nr:hypothetical protein [Bacteroidales bacterium]
MNRDLTTAAIKAIIIIGVICVVKLAFFVFCITLPFTYPWYFNKVKLSDEELKWLKVYEQGDTIVFKSINTLNTLRDSGIVIEAGYNNPRNTNCFDPEGKTWISPDKDIIGCGSIEIETTRLSQNCFEVYFFLFAENYYGFNDITIGHTTTHLDRELRKKGFSSISDTLDTRIIVTRLDTLNDRKGYTKIRQFIWSRDTGLVFYETWEGEKYYLDTIIRASCPVEPIESYE